MRSSNLKTQALSLLLVHCLIITIFASRPNFVRAQAAKLQPAKIAFNPPNPTVEIGKSVKITAIVMDKLGVQIPNAKVEWEVPAGADEFVEVARPLNTSVTTEIVITGKIKNASSTSVVPDAIEIAAKSGKVEGRLILYYKAPAAVSRGTISFFYPSPDTPLAGDIVLTPGSKTKITATVREGGTLVDGSKIKWEVDEKYRAFVDLGITEVDDKKSTVTVGAFFGDGKSTPPASVPIIARAGGASNVVLINYKLAAPSQNRIELVPPKSGQKLSVAPGTDLDLEVKVYDDKNEEVLKPKLEWEAIGSGKDFVRLTPDSKDTRKITVTGLFGPKDAITKPYNISVAARSGTASQIIDVLYLATIEPQVDVQWDVLSQKIVGDNFGRTIKKHFYCLEVVIGNNSGGDLQISGLGFELKVKDEDGRAATAIVPVSSYAVVRGSHSRRKLTHPRALTLATINALGQLLGGFNPFFINATHGKNYGQFVNIISNPLAKGVELVWQDAYPGEVERLDQQALRDDKIIPNNTTFKTRVFFPKDAIFDENEAGRDVVTQVRKRLGNMIMVGHVIERKGFINRLRFGSSTTP